ncbi:ATP-binding protein [Chitinibacter sp. SCUT-21]|uniref:ATP-binding protein n=1 Tax=Chitinibacter sp. SCUT-21 TaxID=2970891 RepID=UPI0035A6F52D
MLTQPFSSTPQFQHLVSQIEAQLHNERDQALAPLEQLLTRARSEHDAVAIITSVELMSQIAYGDNCLDLQYEALQMAQSHHLFAAEARLLNLIGRALYASARYQEAMHIWARCLEVAELSQQYPTWVKAKMGLGQIYDALGDANSAIQMHKEAIARCETIDDRWLLLQAHINLGVNLFKLRQNDAALAAYNFALDTARELKHADDEAEALMRIGEIYIAKQAFSLAITSLDAARFIAERTGYRWALANTLLLYAECLLRMNRHKDALQQAHAGLDVAIQAGAGHVRMKLLFLLSEICEALEDFPTALDRQKQAQQLERQIQHASQRDPLQQIAQIAGVLKNADQMLLDLASSSTLEHGSLKRLSQILCQTACQILHLPQASFWQWSNDDESLMCLQRSNSAGEDLSTGPDLQRHQLVSLFDYLKTGEIIVAHAAAQHQYTWRWSELTLAAQHICAVLLVPIRLNDQTIAVLACEQLDQQRNWQRDEIQHAHQLGLLASRALAQHQQRFYQHQIAALNAQLQSQNEILETRVAERTQALQHASQKLLQAEKLAALGFLVAGFAHKLNTPLGSILTAATTFTEKSQELTQLCATGMMKKSQLEHFMRTGSEIAELIERNAHRASDIIRDLRQLADIDQTAEAKPIKLQQLITPMIERWSATEEAKHLSVINQIDPQLTIVSFSAALEVIVMQLLQNALRHAFTAQHAGQISVAAYQAEAEKIKLIIKDNGVGIAKDLQHKVFEPFYTTKFGQGHSGLGMYQVYSLVQGKLGGEIALHSEEGQGLEITITLPLRAPYLSS